MPCGALEGIVLGVPILLFPKYVVTSLAVKFAWTDILEHNPNLSAHYSIDSSVRALTRLLEQS